MLNDPGIPSNELYDALSRPLAEADLSPFGIENNIVKIADLTNDFEVWNDLREHDLVLRSRKDKQFTSDVITKINTQTTSDDPIPEDFFHIFLTGRQVIQQAKRLNHLALMQDIRTHPDNKCVSGYAKSKKYLFQLKKLMNLQNRLKNIARREKVHTPLGSSDELKFKNNCFGRLWPPGVNLYGVLKHMYPAFHAQTCGYIPLWLAENIDVLSEKLLGKNAIKGFNNYFVNERGLFCSMYPIGEVPENQVSESSIYVSQDQWQRLILAKKVLDDITQLIRNGVEQKIIVIDYAGGSGNLAECLLELIYAHSDEKKKELLLRNVRMVVLDIEEQQLTFGRDRLKYFGESRGIENIQEKIGFIKGDVTESFEKHHAAEIKKTFGIDASEQPIFLGMSSYTIGALGMSFDEVGESVASKLADEMFDICWKMYVIDFSSPSWRQKAFLRDTGILGESYLRVVHGQVGDTHKNTPMHPVVAGLAKLLYRADLKTIGDYAKFAALLPALASHYGTVWPGIGGHHAGYSVNGGGTLIKPGILSFAERLQALGATVAYKSRVNLVTALDLGKSSPGQRAWAFVPGFITDFLLAENPINKPDRCEIN